MEIADYHGCRLSVRRTAGEHYRAYIDGRMIGLWRKKETAMAEAEWAALARESGETAPSPSKWHETMMKHLRRKESL